MNNWKKGGYKADRYFVLATKDLTDGEIQMIADIGVKSDRFVLDFKDDPHAKFALASYAYSVREQNKKLADDIMGLLGVEGGSEAMLKPVDCSTCKNYEQINPNQPPTEKERIAFLQRKIDDLNRELDASRADNAVLQKSRCELIDQNGELGKRIIELEEKQKSALSKHCELKEENAKIEHFYAGKMVKAVERHNELENKLKGSEAQRKSLAFGLCEERARKTELLRENKFLAGRVAELTKEFEAGKDNGSEVLRKLDEARKCCRTAIEERDIAVRMATIADKNYKQIEADFNSAKQTLELVREQRDQEINDNMKLDKEIERLNDQLDRLTENYNKLSSEHAQLKAGRVCPECQLVRQLEDMKSELDSLNGKFDYERKSLRKLQGEYDTLKRCHDIAKDMIISNSNKPYPCSEKGCSYLDNGRAELAKCKVELRKQEYVTAFYKEKLSEVRDWCEANLTKEVK